MNNNGRELAGKLLSSVGFPDPLDSNKSSDEFGLKVAKAIENEWFRRHKNSDARYYDNQYKFHRLRLYARAEQPITKYKNELAVDGDLSYLNLDWTPIPILPKFVDIIVNGISNRLFSVKAQAVDKVATERKSQYVREMEKDMIAKEMLMEANQELGVDAFVNDPNSIPETSEELQIHMQLNYKQSVEIAAEEAISYILKKNEYLESKKRFDYDVATLGIGAMKHSFNESDGIKVEHVDPAYLVHSYSDDPYKRDCYYFGEVRKLPLQELRKINPDLTNEQLDEAASGSSDWDLYHRVNDTLRAEFNGHTCNVLFFTYKTTREKVYKKKTLANGKVRLIRKEEGWNPSPEMMKERGFEKFVKYEDTWYEGALVLGTTMLLKWDLAEWIPRDSATNEPISPYIVVSPRNYDDRAESLLNRMIPHADQIQLAHLKLQQVSSRIVPDGVYVDADGLNEIDLGDGNAYTPKRALQLFFQTGSVIGRSMTSMGEFNHGSVPIKELSHNSGRSKMQALIELYNFNLQMIRDVTGLNEATDGSLPDSRTLVGVQKLAALNSNTATKHITEAGLYATRKIAEAVCMRISDLIKYSDSEEELIDAIGAANVAILDEIKDLPLHRFGIFVEVAPDAQEKEYLEQNIQAALAAQSIYLDDAAEIREIKNTKLANQVMKIRREQKQKAEQQMELERLRTQSEEQTKTVEAKSQGDIAVEQARAQAEIAIETAKAKLKDESQEKEMERKEYLMGVEFDYNMKLKGIDAGVNRRQSDREATQQSRIAAQTDSENGQPNAPVNFESEEDSLDGFDLAQFDPK